MNRILPKSERHKVNALCLDLNEGWFKPRQFDLAIGVAILHHLFDPAQLLKQVYASLKPGASMLYFEPFEPGYAIHSLNYERILERADREGLAPKLRAFFAGKRKHYRMMRCEPKAEAIYADVDDKWCFTTTYFKRIAADLGAALDVTSISPADKPFRSQVTTDLRLGLGLGVEALPTWAWDIVDGTDEMMSADCKADFVLEGCVTFTKPPR